MYMTTKEDFYKFSDNTKNIYTMLNVSLFFIIIIIINPFNIGNKVTVISKFLIVLFLSFILTINFSETINFTKKIPKLFSDIDYINIKNNILLSHTVTLLVLYLIFYIISTFFLATSKI